MSEVKIIGDAVKNMPWQEGPAEFSGAPVCRTATSSSEYSVVSRQTESRTSTLEEAKMRSTGISMRTKSSSLTKKANRSCRFTHMTRVL